MNTHLHTRGRRDRRTAVLSAAFVLLIASCTHEAGGSGATTPSAAQSSTVPTTSPTSGGIPFVARCPHAPSPGHPWKGGPLIEIQGTAHGGSLWALAFAAFPLRAGRAVKIVWRMTGEGILSLVAANAGGAQLPPTDVGQHTGSDWHRMGEEWGSVFRFPTAGCWDVRATRGQVTGDVWLSVA